MGLLGVVFSPKWYVQFAFVSVHFVCLLVIKVCCNLKINKIVDTNLVFTLFYYENLKKIIFLVQLFLFKLYTGKTYVSFLHINFYQVKFFSKFFIYVNFVFEKMFNNSFYTWKKKEKMVYVKNFYKFKIKNAQFCVF